MHLLLNMMKFTKPASLRCLPPLRSQELDTTPSELQAAALALSVKGVMEGANVDRLCQHRSLATGQQRARESTIAHGRQKKTHLQQQPAGAHSTQ